MMEASQECEGGEMVDGEGTDTGSTPPFLEELMVKRILQFLRETLS